MGFNKITVPVFFAILQSIAAVSATKLTFINKCANEFTIWSFSQDAGFSKLCDIAVGGQCDYEQDGGYKYFQELPDWGTIAFFTFDDDQGKDEYYFSLTHGFTYPMEIKSSEPGAKTTYCLSEKRCDQNVYSVKTGHSFVVTYCPRGGHKRAGTIRRRTVRR